MDLCVWARNKTTVHHVGRRRRAKSNKNCLWKKHFEANGGLFLWQKGPCSDCSTWATLHGQFWVVHHNVFGELRKTNKKRRMWTNHCSQWQNASSRTSSPISDFLTGRNVELLSQSTHRPDLAPNDFFFFRTSRKYCVVNDFRQTAICVKLVFSTYCKQYKWWLYVKTCWVQICLKMASFPIKMLIYTWQYQKKTRLGTYLSTFVRPIKPKHLQISPIIYLSHLEKNYQKI